MKALLALSALALVVALAGAARSDVHAASLSSIAAHDGPAIERQVDAEPADADSDSKVPVQVWTVMAAGGAAAVFLLLFFVRIALGRVPPPPPQEEAAHH
jgi:hypothetical protein